MYALQSGYKKILKSFCQIENKLSNYTPKSQIILAEISKQMKIFVKFEIQKF